MATYGKQLEKLVVARNQVAAKARLRFGSNRPETLAPFVDGPHIVGAIVAQTRNFEQRLGCDGDIRQAGKIGLRKNFLGEKFAEVRATRVLIRNRLQR